MELAIRCMYVCRYIILVHLILNISLDCQSLIYEIELGRKLKINNVEMFASTEKQYIFKCQSKYFRKLFSKKRFNANNKYYSNCMRLNAAEFLSVLIKLK